MKALQLESVVTIDCIPPGDRERMAQSLAQAAVVAAMSDYESHPVAVMEAVALGIPTVGLDTAGVGDLVRAGLVRGVPKQASPRMIAEVLVSALRGQRTVGPAGLPTWDTAAEEVARVYMEAVRVPPRSVNLPGP